MTGKKRIDVFNLVPWFILGFLLLAALLSFGVIRADLTPRSGD